MTTSIKPYNCGERVLRTAVFQNGVAHRCLEKSLIHLVTGCQQKTSHPKVFDPSRAEQGLLSWKKLGATEFTLTPRDGKAKINGVFWRAERLEEILTKAGARWERIEVVHEQGYQTILAIIPPASEELDPAWNTLENALASFNWRRQQVTTSSRGVLSVIVTCHEADELSPEGDYGKIFIHSNSASVAYVMLKRRAGFYLGMKQNLCFYDPRGTWKSTGVASEGGHYNDILAVYQTVRKEYTEEQIWVSGACLGCTAVAFLKETTREGFNLILENGFADFEKDFLGHENAVARAFAKQFRKGLFSRDLPSPVKPRETSFSIETSWKNFTDSHGKIVIVSVENDQRLPPIVRSRNLQLAQKTSKTVYSITFYSPDKDPHFDRYFLYEPARRSLIHIFKAPPSPISFDPFHPPHRPSPISFKLVFTAAIVAIVSVYLIYRRY